MFKLKKYLKNYKKELILGPIFKLVEAIFELIVPLVMAKIIDVGIKSQDVNYILKMGGVMVILGAVGLCSALTCQFLASRASQGFGTDVRNDLFRHINTLSHAEIDEIGTSSMITRITNDVNQLQTAVAMLIRLVIRAPFLVIGATVMSFFLDVKLSLIFLFIIPLVAVVLYQIMAKSIPFYRVIQKKLDKISLITGENLKGARVIRSFSKQDAENERFLAASNDHMQTSISVGKISALLNPLTYLIMNFAILAIIWFGGMRVDGGAMTQGEIIAFVNYMSQILLALVVVANLVVTFTKAAASATRVNEIFEKKSSVFEDVSTENPTKNSDKKISFRNVWFSYNKNEEYAVKGISVDILVGETIGIIGGTGSGKSTFINLIPRFYDVDKGEIFVDGLDVKRYKFSELRSKIGLVPQKAVLFSGTLEENLRWGNENASVEEIWRAIKISQADEFVNRLPDGLQTQILQGGKNLSGGQKQRLTIARALIRKPEILVLDDSASALDFATDAALRGAIQQETENLTVIIVSQRANSIKNADKIIVFDDGEAVGIGTHEELFESCEIYREICLSQDENGVENL